MPYEYFIIIFTWIMVWINLYKNGPKLPQLPIHKTLQVLSILTFITIFIFYSISFNLVTFLPQFVITHQFLKFFLYVMIIIGSILIIKSRNKINSLSAQDVIFGKNLKYQQEGVYKIFNHPMYIGIMIILISSWFLFPTVLGIFCLMVVILLLIGKSLKE